MISFDNALPFITLLIGGFTANRLQLGLARRKDFNAVSNPLFENLEKQRLCAISGDFPNAANSTTQETFIALVRKSPWYKKAGLKHAIENYLQAKEGCGNWNNGRYHFCNPDLLIKAIENIQHYVPYK